MDLNLGFPGCQQTGDKADAFIYLRLRPFTVGQPLAGADNGLRWFCVHVGRILAAVPVPESKVFWHFGTLGGFRVPKPVLAHLARIDESLVFIG